MDPQDVPVVGFDGDLEAAGANPPLVTLRQPHDRGGEVEASHLVGKREGHVLLRPDLLPIELVMRASTGLPPAGVDIRR